MPPSTLGALRVIVFTTPRGSIVGEAVKQGLAVPGAGVEVAQGDIAPSTVLHIPSIDTVIGGDVVYNRIHMMLALTGPAEWQKWIDSIDLVESLGAKTIIAGHKQPDASDEDLETILDGSRGYIRDFRDAVAASSTADEVIETMKTKYLDYGNLTTLEFSARAALPA
jgi:glyoxylase-like metal-dependent hydrolase (beta-lactamase superfamily II)